MNAILNITLPIFILIGLGYALVRGGAFTADQFRAVGRIVVTLALPAVIVRALSSSEAADVFNGQYLIGYGGASLVVLGIGLAIGLLVRRRSLTVAALRSLGMSNSNSAFIGFAVAYQLLGPPAVVGLALNAIIENVLMTPTALVFAEIGQGDRDGLRKVAARTAISLAKNPILIAVAFGMVLTATGFDLPAPIAKAVDMVANIAAAASLLVIGGSLVGLQTKGLWTTIAIMGTGKLLLHPLAVLGGITLMGMTDPDMRATALVYAASPMMSVLPLLAVRYGEEGPCAAALLATTLGSFFTLSAWIWLLGHGVVG